MRITRDHDCTTRCICHMNATAQEIHQSLLRADQTDAAESLRKLGTFA